MTDPMADTIAALKLQSIGRIVERLLQEQSKHETGCLAAVGEWCSATVEIAPLVAELRGILDGVGPDFVGQAIEQAMAELALWSRRHRDACEVSDLEAALLIEAVSLAIEQGRSVAQYRDRCEGAWTAVAVAQAEMGGLDLIEVPTWPDAEASRIMGDYARSRGVTRDDPTD